FLPNRVLDLGSYDESLTADICLLDGASHKTARYAALSHRWSSPPRIELTNETYLDRLRNIPFTSLPMLFRDAVTFCRQVGVRYLWIDALCIIQRDETDWRIESGRMGGIYKDAYCVLLAHFAGGDDEGFLQEAFCEPERIAINPLSKRGWVFQERMLATRAIHFARKTVTLENMGILTGSADRETAQREMKRLLLGQENVEPRVFRQLWAELVQSLTACDLTREKDKLPAISGLAKILHSSRADQYFLSGLWSSDLREQLLWVSASKSGSRFEWRAPSWSWASLNG
ncbi:HET-domain-containing protein, partial [Acephala macrosclerotiorum]